MSRLTMTIGVAVMLWGLGAGAARAQEAGTSGGACYGNGTCNAGLSCQAGTCVAAQTGALGGACYGNSTCNSGMTCDGATQTCVAAAVEPAGATATPVATTA